jgi:hypothetical protein
MIDLKNTNTEAENISADMEKMELSSVKTILRIDKNQISFVEVEEDRFAFFVKSPVNQAFTIDWGDGCVCRHEGSDKRILLSHKYSHREEAVITIYGVITTLISIIFDLMGNRELVGNDFCVETCDIRNNPYIEAIECPGKLLLHNNDSLKELYRFAVGIKSEHLAQLPSLECIEFMDSFYTGALDFSLNPKLKYLRCPCNNITSLNVSLCPDLEYIDICYAQCRLDLENNHKLKYLFADGVKKKNIRLPKGRTVITEHVYNIPENYWTILSN